MHSPVIHTPSLERERSGLTVNAEEDTIYDLLSSKLVSIVSFQKIYVSCTKDRLIAKEIPLQLLNERREEFE